MTMTQAVSDERLREIVQKIVDDAELRVVTMKPTYDAVDLGIALLRPLLALRSATPEPAAWVLVPREATEAMWRVAQPHNHNVWSHQIEAIWRSMIAAAPAAPTSTEAGREISDADVEQAFRDGLDYATICKVTDPDEAWRTSRARAAINKGGE